MTCKPLVVSETSEGRGFEPRSRHHNASKGVLPFQLNATSQCDRASIMSETLLSMNNGQRHYETTDRVGRALDGERCEIQEGEGGILIGQAGADKKKLRDCRAALGSRTGGNEQGANADVTRKNTGKEEHCPYQKQIFLVCPKNPVMHSITHGWQLHFARAPQKVFSRNRYRFLLLVVKMSRFVRTIKFQLRSPCARTGQQDTS